MTVLNYMDIIGTSYPTVFCHVVGDPDQYDNIVSDGGDPIPSRADLDQEKLMLVKASVIDGLSDDCANFIMDGFTCTALGSAYIYDTQTVDQINLIGAVTATSPSPITGPTGMSIYYAVRDASTMIKAYVLHTHNQLAQVLAEGAMFKLIQLQKFNVKRDYITNICATIEQVEAVTWDSNP